MVADRVARQFQDGDEDEDEDGPTATSSTQMQKGDRYLQGRRRRMSSVGMSHYVVSFCG